MKYKLVTNSNWAGTKQYHEIDGDYDTPEDALEAFGGDEEAWCQTIEDHCPEYYIEEDKD